MTKREFKLVEQNALRSLQRFSNISDSENIVFVMSKDVYVAALSNPDTAYRVADYSEDGAQVGTHSVYRGYDIFIINEEHRAIFQPAIKEFRIPGFDYYQLSPGDFVLSDDVDDNIHIFSKVDGDLLRFNDTYLTANLDVEYVRNGRFVSEEDRVHALREQREHEFAQMWRLEFDPDWAKPMVRPASWNEAVRFYPPPWSKPEASWFCASQEVPPITQQISACKKAKRKKASPAKDWDERLTPDDTKELDEFLDSLTHKGTLGSAT